MEAQESRRAIPLTIEIRNFENTDLGLLASIWQQHYQEAGIASSCPTTVWEYCVLSKPFFDPNDFLIARWEGEAVGFVHFANSGNAEGTDSDPSVGLINSLCVIRHPEESRIAQQLLSESTARLKRRGAKMVLGGSSPKHFAFYLGILPGDGMLGVPSCDVRFQQWLLHDGMRPWQPTARWELELASYRPPMDRTQIQIRRQFQVNRVVDGQQLPWWIATSFGHAEQQHFQLASRSQLQLVSSVTFWQPDTTIRGLDSSGYMMVFEVATDEPEARDRLVFLLSESLRQLQQDRVERVRVVSLSDQVAATNVLQRLGFRSTETGVVFRLDCN